MRIAVVTEYYRPTLGGIQEHVFHFARVARRLGHQVTIVTGGVGDHLDAPEDDVVRIGRSLPVRANGSVGRVTVGLRTGRALKRLLTADRFDVVHLHAPLSPILPVLANLSTTLPLVATHHTNFAPRRLYRLGSGIARRLMQRIDRHIAVSHACVRALEPFLTARFALVPNGVDVSAWRAGRPLERLRAARPVVVFLGRLEPRCGLDRVIRAWPRLRGTGVDPLLFVIGDGPLRGALELMAREARVRAQFAGARWEDRADLLASADLMVCPTTIASFGVTLLEGMAAGLPIVASDIDGFREVLTDGQEGLLVDTAVPTALAQAMATLLQSPALASAMAREGRRTAHRYDWDQVARRVLDVLATAVSRPRMRQKG